MSDMGPCVKDVHKRLKTYFRTPTINHTDLDSTMLISIAYSAAIIADKLTENEWKKEIKNEIKNEP